jgi:hypothetical protein
MNLKVLIAAPLVAWLMIASAATIVKPAGWAYSHRGNGPESYSMGVDKSVTWNGMPTLTIMATGQRNTASGDAHNYAMPTGYGGKRVRFSGMLKLADVDGWAGVYIRAGKEHSDYLDLGFPPLGSGGKGSSVEWKPVSVVVDIPMEVVAPIRIGLILVGNGQVWLSDLRFEEVGAEVAVTTSRVEIDQEQLQRERTSQFLSQTQLGKRPPSNLELKTQ